MVHIKNSLYLRLIDISRSWIRKMYMFVLDHNENVYDTVVTERTI